MRVLVYEQFYPGHYYYYVHYLLPALLEITDDVVLAITPQGRASAEFADLVEPFASRVKLDDSLPFGDDRVMKKEHVKIHQDLREAVSRAQPDYVLVPSGDTQTTAMGLFRLTGQGGLPNRRRGEVGIHFGLTAQPGAKSVIKQKVDELKLLASGWERFHIINLLFYERLKASGGAVARRAALLPHPVKPNRKGKLESRRALGIPEEGRILGVAGVIDYRKAIAEMLWAFRRASDRPTDRLLLAGPLSKQFRTLLAGDYRDLVDSGRIIALDRFLDADSNQTALAAMDVVCTPYPKFMALSSVLLEGLAAGRPVLSTNTGWCREIVDRFGAGWTCDVLNPDMLTKTMRIALDEHEQYEHTEATKRLLSFHAPSNFAASFLLNLRSMAGLPPSSDYRPWSTVQSG